MSSTRRLPSADAMSLRGAIDRMFDDALLRWWSPDARMEMRARLPMDIVEKDNQVIVKASIPGFKKDDITVEVRDDMLTIRANAHEEEKKKEEDFYLNERYWGKVERTVELPCPVEADRAEATYENGTLMLKLPKNAVASTKRVEIH